MFKKCMKFAVLTASALALLPASSDLRAQAPGVASGAAPATGTPVLDTNSYWRVFYTLKTPVVKDGNNLKLLTTLTGDTPLPPKEWAQAEFDDGNWTRVTGKPFPAEKDWNSNEIADAGITGREGTSPALALICLRGKFGVTDPAAVMNLKLTVAYRGGVVVYVNGKEVGRSDIAKDAAGPDALAAEYPKEAFLKADGNPMFNEGRGKDAEILAGWKARVRQAEIAIPAASLRQGTNVLAIEIHRAPYRAGVKEWIEAKHIQEYQMYSFLWATCGLHAARLESGSPAGLQPNVSRPRGVQVWNSQPMQVDFDLDYGDPFEPLAPIKLIGSRGGNFSGKVVVGSDQAIKGLKGTIGDLTGKSGGKIAATAMQVRYALPTGSEPVAGAHYPAAATMLDGLADSAPATVDVRGAGGRGGAGSGGWSFGAVCPVWVTVAVPADAAPGDYAGKLTIAAEGHPPVDVPVELKVLAWHVPKPSEFHTVVDLMESPESVAMQYGVPLYGDKHFQLLAKSFERAGYAGSWTVHIPLICQSNLGNDQTMVRWIKKPDGTFKYDFTVMDKYLDAAEKGLGKPRIIFLIVWDYFIGIAGQAHQGLHPEIEKVLPKGGEDVPVSVLDEATGTVTMETVGRYDAAGKARWQAMTTELVDHLRKRGLEKAVVLGTVDDVYPTEEIVKFWKDLMPDTKWGRYSHYESKGAQNGSGPPVEYQAHAYVTEWSLKPVYGWKRADKTVQFFRMGGFGDIAQPWISLPMDLARVLGEINIQGPRRGFGRVGLDYWPVLKNGRGQAVASIQGRFPKSFWRQLDMMVRGFVPPGPDGAMASTKLEMMREGLQEAEARIFLESVLTDARKGRIGGLAAKAQQVLDERVRALNVTLENQAIAGFVANPKPWLDGYGAGDFHATQAGIFRQWYMESGWQERSEKLYAVAAEVAAALGQP